MSNFFVLLGLVLVICAVGILTNSVGWPMLVAGLSFVWVGFVLAPRADKAKGAS